MNTSCRDSSGTTFPQALALELHTEGYAEVLKPAEQERQQELHHTDREGGSTGRVWEMAGAWKDGHSQRAVTDEAGIPFGNRRAVSALSQ